LPVFVFFLLTTSLICVIMAYVPAIILILAIIWGVLLIMGGLYLTPAKILSISLINAIVLYSIAGVSNFLFYLAFFGLAAFVMAVLAAYGKGYYELQKWGMMSCVIGVSLFLLISYAAAGGLGINEFETGMNEYIDDSMATYEKMGIFDAYEQMGIGQTELEQAMKDTMATFARHLPAFYYIQAIIAVFFMLFLASILSLKSNIVRLKRKSFNEETMPWQFVWLAIAALGLWIWGRDELNYIYYIGSNMLMVMAPIALYFGLSTLTFKINQLRPNIKMWLVIGFIFLAIVFPLSAIMFVSIIGLFDSLVDFRKLRIEQED